MDAFLRAGASDACNGEAFNVGGDEHIAHRDLVELLVELAGTGRYRFVEWPPEKKVDRHRQLLRRLDAASSTRTGWAPRVSAAPKGFDAHASTFYRARAMAALLV